MVYKNYIKPFLDVILSMIGLIMLSPILIVLLIILSIEHKGNPFFLQNRAGKNGKVFKIIKLKTMTDKTDSDNVLLPHNKRLTNIGKFIRKSSLDEIPQLFNVLKRDMSLIGPRPLHVEYLPYYDSEQSKRHDLLPGITGWAQVNGRNAISWEQKFIYDVWYVKNLSLWLDLKIIGLTLLKIFNTSDINNSEDINMPSFKDTKIG